MNDYLNSVIKQFEYYKSLAEKTFEQLPEDKLFWKYNNESNSIGILVNHISGNMISRCPKCKRITKEEYYDKFGKPIKEHIEYSRKRFSSFLIKIHISELELGRYFQSSRKDIYF